MKKGPEDKKRFYNRRWDLYWIGKIKLFEIIITKHF